MSDPKDYTIGWICAIVTEYVAAQACLDEIHERPEAVSANDPNDYTVGKIGKHLVVLAVLPDGEYGLSSAASVASNLLLSFPNVRIGLMVGIGGGVPTIHDIRLGDVVVSSPRSGKGGVFQYDFGMTEQGGKFQHTRYLNQPPTILRTAVTGVKAQHELHGHELGNAVEETLARWPNLREKYMRPEANTDRLYHSHVIHPSEDIGCQESCGDNASKLKDRPKRSGLDGNVVNVHYGVIASANQLMKNALVRDVLAREKDVLCFEMEAAGLMNHFPCLVVRGICDYSDSHINKVWQGYAAMTSAAYVKELIRRISPTKVEAERRINDVLSSISKGVDGVQATLSDLSNAYKDGSLERWLSAPDPSSNHEAAIAQRHGNSGRWLLQHEAFSRWKKSRNSLLWLWGIPGCGKTVLSSIVINELSKEWPRSLLLYFYFDFKDARKQTPEQLIRSFVNQVRSNLNGKWEQLSLLFTTHGNGKRQSTVASLLEMLLSKIKQYEEVWIVIDALDECSERKGHTVNAVLSWLKVLLQVEQGSVHALVTSRFEQDIESEISNFACATDSIPVHRQSHFLTGDIRDYIHATVSEDKAFERWQSRPEIQLLIESKLVEKSAGMFRWVKCQLDALEKCLDSRALRDTLLSLPDSLDATYARILQQIPTQYKQSSIRILQLLVFSEQPLKVRELIDALAIEMAGYPRFDPRNRMPDPSEISRYCSGLTCVVGSIDDEEPFGELQLSHSSVKEYLLSGRTEFGIARHFHERVAKRSIAELCVAYLLDCCDPLRMSIQQIQCEFPFALFAARHWTYYAAETEEGDTLYELIMQFFHSSTAITSWLQLYDPELDVLVPKPETRTFNPASGLYYAALLGLTGIVSGLLEQGFQVNNVGGRYGTALQAAAVAGFEHVVRILLQHGAHVNQRSGELGYALQAASQSGCIDIVRFLLDHGAEVNATGGFFGCALIAAATDAGHLGIVGILLEEGADVNMQGGIFGSALHSASRMGHFGVVERLLDHGANINAHDRYIGSPLQAASLGGHARIVHVLLERGANINLQGGTYGNALQAASWMGWREAVQMLLGHGADVNARGGQYGSALGAAITRQHQEVIQILLEHGADDRIPKETLPGHIRRRNPKALL